MYPHGSSMDQRIFTVGLSTTAVSCYLLCCGLQDAGRKVTRQNMVTIWNSDIVALDHSLKDLEACNIIQRCTSDSSEPAFCLVPADRWQASQTKTSG